MTCRAKSWDSDRPNSGWERSNLFLSIRLALRVVQQVAAQLRALKGVVCRSARRYRDLAGPVPMPHILTSNEAISGAIMSDLAFLDETSADSGLIAADRLSDLLHITRAELATAVDFPATLSRNLPASVRRRLRRGYAMWSRSSTAFEVGPGRHSRLLLGIARSLCPPLAIRRLRRW